MAMDLNKLKGLKVAKGGVGSGLLSEASKAESLGEKAEIVYLHVSKLVPNEKNFYSQEEIEERAESIAQVGQLSPIRVTPIEDGKYRIYSGESRYRALNLLYSQGKDAGYAACIIDDFEKIKKKIYDETGTELSDDEVERLMIIEPNAQTRSYTEADKMKEASEKRELYRKLKRKGLDEVLGTSLKGKVRDIVAESMGISSTQAGQYLAVSDKGTDELKEAMEENRIKIDAAYMVAQQDEDTQKEIIEETKDKERVTKKDIEEIIDKNNEEKQPQKIKYKSSLSDDEMFLTDKDWKMDIKSISKALKTGIILKKDDYNHYQELLREIKQILQA